MTQLIGLDKPFNIKQLEAPTVRKKCQLVRPCELALISTILFVTFLLSSVN